MDDRGVAAMTAVPDTSRGRFLRSAERAAMYAAREQRLQDLWDRAARGDILLTDIPEADRWAVRTRYVMNWEWFGDGLTTVVFPAGHVDPFAGREDDEYFGPDVQVRFADEAPDKETDPDGWFAFWFGPPIDLHDLGNLDDAADEDAGDEESPGDGAQPEGESERRAEPAGGSRSVAGATMPASAFPATFEVPEVLPREDAGMPVVLDQVPLSATHRFAGRWLGAPVSDLRWTKVAAAPDGSVWQSLMAEDEVRRYNAAGRLVERYGGQFDARTRFRAPLGLAVHPDGSVFVADNEHARVQRIVLGGAIEPDWFVLEPRPYDVVGIVVTMDSVDPVDVAISPDGQEILVLDYGWRLLFRLGTDGDERFPDREPEHTNKATSLSVSSDGERTYLLRNRGADVEWVSADDDAVWQPPAHMELARFRDVEAAPDGTLYLLDEDAACLHWLDSDGVPLDSIPVGQRPGEERERIGPFLFAQRVAFAAPTGVAAARHGDGIRVYVTLRDGAILVFERPVWTGPHDG